jgi:hypothetical protein
MTTNDTPDLGLLLQHVPLPSSTGMDALETRIILLQEVPPKRELRFYAVRGEAREMLSSNAAQAVIRDHFPSKSPVEMSDIELWAEISVLRMEANRMRPVYEAAKTWRAAHSGLARLDRPLVDAVDTAIAAEVAAESNP